MALLLGLRERTRMHLLSQTSRCVSTDRPGPPSELSMPKISLGGGGPVRRWLLGDELLADFFWVEAFFWLAEFLSVFFGWLSSWWLFFGG